MDLAVKPATFRRGEIKVIVAGIAMIAWVCLSSFILRKYKSPYRSLGRRSGKRSSLLIKINL